MSNQLNLFPLTERAGSALQDSDGNDYINRGSPV